MSQNQDREWNIDNVNYKYRAPGNNEIGDDGHGLFFDGDPPTGCRAVRPQWLTMPALADTYGTAMLKEEHVVKFKSDHLRTRAMTPILDSHHHRQQQSASNGTGVI